MCVCACRHAVSAVGSMTIPDPTVCHPCISHFLYSSYNEISFLCRIPFTTTIPCAPCVCPSLPQFSLYVLYAVSECVVNVSQGCENSIKVNFYNPFFPLTHKSTNNDLRHLYIQRN